MPVSLKQKTMKGIFWSFFDSFGIYVIKFGFSIAIARALSPSDYGVIGMVVIFTAIGSMLTESGFAMALIQKKNADNKDYSTIFWFNIIVALLFYFLLFTFSGKISEFYDNPIIKNVIRISGLNIILSSLWLIQVTILTKELNFKKQSLVNITAAVGSGIIGVILSYKDFGVWSLVFMTLGGSTLRVVGFWSFTKWTPSLIFNGKSFKSLYSYGYKIFLQGMSDVIFTKIYYPLIGEYYSASGLGFYTYASRFYDIFIRRVTIAYGRVTFSMFSLINDEKERFKKNYLKTFRLLVYVLFPFTTILIISAELFVHLILTDKWLPIVPYIRIFYIEGFFFPLYMLNQNVFNALGRSDISLRIDIMKKVLLLLSIFIAFKYGIKALIGGQIISSFIVYLISTYRVNKIINIPIYKQIIEIIPIIGMLVLLVFINKFVLMSFVLGNWYLFVSQILLLPAIYLFLAFIFRIKAQQEMIILIAGRK